MNSCEFFFEHIIFKIVIICRDILCVVTIISQCNDMFSDHYTVALDVAYRQFCLV